MVHACAACTLRFASTGELRDHVESDHVLHPAVESVHSHLKHREKLGEGSYTRSGWVSRKPQT